jgi:hypothetical protein
VKRLVGAAVHGRIDVMINNAGLSTYPSSLWASGYAATYGTLSRDLPAGNAKIFKERIARRAVDKFWPIRDAAAVAGDAGHLEQKWNEASSAAHVLRVRLAQGRDERGFLNGYAVCIGSSHAGKKRDKPCPVPERQTQSDESDESAGVGGMADVAIRSDLNAVWPA